MERIDSEQSENKNVDIEYWNYVTSENNFAYVTTCRNSPNSFVKKLLWWNGTTFLKDNKDSWLKANCIKDCVIVDFSSNEKAKQCFEGE